VKSYFEIHGHIVECVVTSLPSPHFGGIAAERPGRGRKSAKAESLMSAARDTGESRPTLFEHWKKTSFHNVDRLSQLTRREQVALVKRPHLFALWGIQGVFEVIEMHADYIHDY